MHAGAPAAAAAADCVQRYGNEGGAAAIAIVCSAAACDARISVWSAAAAPTARAPNAWQNPQVSWLGHTIFSRVPIMKVNESRW